LLVCFDVKTMSHKRRLAFRRDNLSPQYKFGPNALLQRRSSIQQMGKTVCSLVRYRRKARSRNSMNYTSQFVDGWPKELLGVSTRIDIICACLYWLNGKLFHRNLAGLLTKLLNQRTVPELDRHNLFFGCVLLILSISLIAIPAISQEKRYRRLIVRSEGLPFRRRTELFFGPTSMDSFP